MRTISDVVMTHSFVEHIWKHCERWQAYPLSRVFIRGDDVYDHGAAQCVHVSAELAHQLFMLDGPTPSHSGRVRVGGIRGCLEIGLIYLISCCLVFERDRLVQGRRAIHFRSPADSLYCFKILFSIIVIVYH